MRTGTGWSRWIRRQTSRPSKPGSMRSRTTRSGRTRSTRATPDGPSAATSTSKPSLRSRAATAAAMGSSSSMTTTLANSHLILSGRGRSEPFAAGFGFGARTARIRNRRRGRRWAVGRLPLGEHGRFGSGDGLDVVGRHPEPVDDRPVEDPGAAAGDGTHGQLLVARHPELADEEDVEWGGQDPGHLAGHGHAAPGQAEHQPPLGEPLQDPGLDQAPAEDLAGVAPVPEARGGGRGSHGYDSRRWSSSGNSGK